MKIGDELCLIIFLKQLKIELPQSEIDYLRDNIEMIEQQLYAYGESFDYVEDL